VIILQVQADDQVVKSALEFILHVDCFLAICNCFVDL